MNIVDMMTKELPEVDINNYIQMVGDYFASGRVGIVTRVAIDE